MRTLHHRLMPVVLPCLFLAGCAAWSSSPPLSQPYFIVDAGEAKSFHALAKKQEAFAPKCAEHNPCDHVYFTRALLGLYESRESASKYFEKVIAVVPKSRLASSSKLWLQLLPYHVSPVEQSWFQSVMSAPAMSESQAILAQGSDRLVRDLLDRELFILQLRGFKGVDALSLESCLRDSTECERRMEALSDKKEASKFLTDTGMVRSLQRQLTERDKKIETLASQLEALKRIDQEMRDKVRPIHPSLLEPTTP